MYIKLNKNKYYIGYLCDNRVILFNVSIIWVIIYLFIDIYSFKVNYYIIMSYIASSIASNNVTVHDPVIRLCT